MSFRRAFKQVVLALAARQVHPSFAYRIEGIPLERVLEGRLFLQRVDNYHSEDYFCGKSGATVFEFSEVDASCETRDIRGDSIVCRVFRGIYFVADFNKHFRTRTLVVPRTGRKKRGFLEFVSKPELGGRASPRAQTSFGILGNQGSRGRSPSRTGSFGTISFSRLFGSTDSSRGCQIGLEDPDFEREFDVFADDEVEARYLLTPALMTRILSLKSTGGQVALSFLNGQVHVALGVARDLFEPDVFTPVSDARQMAGFLNDLRCIMSIIEILNLNTRIWSKS